MNGTIHGWSRTAPLDTDAETTNYSSKNPCIVNCSLTCVEPGIGALYFSLEWRTQFRIGLHSAFATMVGEERLSGASAAFNFGVVRDSVRDSVQLLQRLHHVTQGFTTRL
jgi:hypothetical protein